jgi:RNA polymerase sigma-70 factor (ECF subfamily)
VAEPSEPSSPIEIELAHIAAAQQDIRAFAPLYESYVDLVWRYALSRLGDPQRAADATSITFQRAIAAIPSFQPQRRGEITTFRSWLMTIARNVVIDQARRDRPATNFEDPAAQRWLIDTRRGPEELAVAADERHRVGRALAQLPDTQRQIVELRLIGMKGIEIAGMLGMSESAVKTAHFRAYARLRVLLSEPNENQEQTR